MAKKQMAWKTKGMNQDLSVSAFNPEFSFENRNLRLSTKENNTLLSWVNERGPKLLSLEITDYTLITTGLGISSSTTLVETPSTEIQGVTIGTAVINHLLVIFTTAYSKDSPTPDSIYVLKYESGKLKGFVFFRGNLNFSVTSPLETIVNYESSFLQKVYWTDGVNLPRLINIADTTEKRLELRIAFSENGEKVPIYTLFDFVPTFTGGKLSIIKQYSGGRFAPGVIQYCFTYLNKYGLESNIVDVASLLYISHLERAAAPDASAVLNSFVITISNLDLSFDSVRVYSIHNTFINLATFVKHLIDIPIENKKVLTFTDSGSLGDYISLDELLYKGGKEITALTIRDKDNALFLGNITEKNINIKELQNYFDDLRNSDSGGLIEFSASKTIPLDINKNYYSHSNTLKYNLREITTFKGGEWYRFGFQLLKKTGEWTEPIFIEDHQNLVYPVSTKANALLVKATAEIPLNIIDRTFFKKIRPLIVYPSAADRAVICLGVLNPTVFRVKERKNNTPYSLASWYFRPNVTEEPDYLLFDLERYEQLKKWTAENHHSNPDNRQTLSKPLNINTINGFINGLITSAFSPAEFTRVYILIACINLEYAPLDYKINTSNSSINEIYNKPSSYVFDTGCIYFAKRACKIYDGRDGFTYEAQDSSWELVKHDFDLGYIRFTESREGRPDSFSDPNEVTEVIDNMYCFISSTPWPDLGITGGGDKAIYTVCVSRLSKVKTDRGNGINSLDTPILNKLFTGMLPITAPRGGRGVPESELYYGNRDINDGVYNFRFAVISRGSTEEQLNGEDRNYIYNSSSAELYEINLAAPVETETNTNVIVGNRGDDLIFKRMQSLPHWDTYTNALSGNVGNPMRTAEILYASNFIYDGMRSELNGENTLLNYTLDTLPSNNLFFVDRSIMTLNSPDIEFNDDVRAQSLEGLLLRIVGVIPITASCSAHSIFTKGGKLSTYQRANNIDEADKGKYGAGEMGLNSLHYEGVKTAGKHLVADLLWEDVEINTSQEDSKGADNSLVYTYGTTEYLIYPWNLEGPLNNDVRGSDIATSVLTLKMESNLLYSSFTEYTPLDADLHDVFDSIDARLHLLENSIVYNIKLSSQKELSSDVNYSPNFDGVLYNTVNYASWKGASAFKEANGINPNCTVTINGTPFSINPNSKGVSMRYLSGSHAVIVSKEHYDSGQEVNRIKILPYKKPTNSNPAPDFGYYIGGTNESLNSPMWSNVKNWYYEQFPKEFSNEYPRFLWLGELFDPTDNPSRFGDPVYNDWLICGDSIKLPSNSDAKSVTLEWTEGDTYFLRYDCLKTYAFTPQDTNLIIEILSFMCETRTNTDGRYDENRGLLDNTVMSPLNFNLLNPVYSLLNNFFVSKMTDVDIRETLDYPNYVTFTSAKTSGSSVDLWTHIDLGSAVELEGDKGEITALRKLNDILLAFLERGLALIPYNDLATISTNQGVPLEIAKSAKVSQPKYISDTIGCSNKWSICLSPSGIYFMDSNNKEIYLFNGQLQNLSTLKGFSAWSKNNITSDVWNPVEWNGFVSYYDSSNKDILFINRDIALAYSEPFGVFTSFYDYGRVPYFNNLDDLGLWTTSVPLFSYGNIYMKSYIYLHQEGNYCNFFGVNKPYYTILISNPEPLVDKTFTNMEFRACVDGEGTYSLVSENSQISRYEPYLPFDYLETWNEYLHGYTELKTRWGTSLSKHHKGDESSLIRKFRIWRCDVPRNNIETQGPFDTSFDYTFHGSKKYKLDRMRNPWLYVKLVKRPVQNDSLQYLNRTEIHDMVMDYYD